MRTKDGLPAIHPGVFLKEILQELGLSLNAFAVSIGVSPMRVSHVIGGRRPVTAELAVLFAKAFEQTAEYWMNLQTSYDLKIAQQTMSEKIVNVRSLVPSKPTAGGTMEHVNS